jgi:hypothetical protein
MRGGGFVLFEEGFCVVSCFGHLGRHFVGTHDVAGTVTRSLGRGFGMGVGHLLMITAYIVFVMNVLGHASWLRAVIRCS